VSGSAAQLLVDLVRTPSPSGREGVAAELLAGWAAARGLVVAVDDAAVRLELAGPAAGPTLLFASHLDTVPAGEGWSVDPFAGVVAEGRLTGRGAVDAKASVAAMAVAAAALGDGGGPACGRLIVLATYAEETRDTTMPRALERLGEEPAAAVVGEPTSLAPCIAQRGQLLLKLSWRGEQLHAGWAAERRPPPANAIRLAAHDLAALDDLRFERRHPLLGEVVVTPTLLQAGVARNVTPPRCEAVLDIRTTPCYEHAEVTAAVAARVMAEVEVLSDRLLPAATPEGSALLAALVRVRPEAESVASPTCSDWTFLRHLDALKLGPGDSRRSHTADEWVELAEVEEAARLYLDLAREVLG